MAVSNDKRLMVVGASATSSLEKSYVRAAEQLGYTVCHFDPEMETGKHIKLGKIGAKLHQFLPVEAWVRKMNRELVLKVKEFNPQVILVFTNVKVLYGSLATIKTMMSPKIVWIWPDTPLNLTAHNRDAAGLYDVSAIYSSTALPVFSDIGFKNLHWVPLAGDPFLHGQEPVPSRDFKVDISFVGMWRPERERAMAVVAEHFPNLAIEIYGTYWKERCGNQALKKYWRGGGIVGKELGAYFNRSRINVNVIDDTNYPSANMRFFEVPTAGGLQLSSPCPEQENIFRHQQEIVYFSSEQQLVEQVRWILDNPAAADQIRMAAHKKVQEGHTYLKRLEQILSIITIH